MTEREPIGPGTPTGPSTGASAYPPQDPAEHTVPQYADRPVALRRPESLGGLLLILAGIAAGLSLLMDWLADDDISGWGLVRAGFDDLGNIFDDGLWQPLAIVLGGGLLFVLGILLWLPMRSHRFFGLLALLISLGVTAGVLVPFQDADWDLGFFGPGFYCAILVAVLGLLGSIKALISGKKYPR
jgi:hypothetical protein